MAASVSIAHLRLPLNTPRAGFPCPRVLLGTGKGTSASSRRIPALAKTLKAIVAKGARAFYEGEIADDMARTLAARDSFLTAEDFARHRGEVVTPISTNYRGLDLVEIP